MQRSLLIKICKTYSAFNMEEEVAFLININVPCIVPQHKVLKG